jgi:hypothetical protein
MKSAVTAMLFLAGLSGAVSAKEILVPVHWPTWTKGELSIARMRMALGPKIRKEVCRSFAGSLKAGNTVKVVFYGAGKEVLTSFSYRHSHCK